MNLEEFANELAVRLVTDEPEACSFKEIESFVAEIEKVLHSSAN